MSEKDTLLAQSSNSLALMLMGLDRSLDTKLKEFRSILKERELDEDRLKLALEQTEQVYDQLEPTIDEHIQVFAQSFSQLMSLNDEARREQLLAPLLSGTAYISDLLRLADPVAKHIRKMSSVSDADDHEQLRQQLSSRFLSLLKVLSIMGDDDGSLVALAKKLDPVPSWQGLDQLANDTIALLQTRISEEKEQFEVYLAELNAKLKRINDIVQADSETLSEIKQINLDFNQSINQQMQEARDKIDHHSELKLLKSDLLTSLDAITQQLISYQQSYASRLDQLQNSKSAMNDQIASLEKENVNLIKELHKERKLSLIDPLTQLPNRLAFEKRLDEELARALRYRQPLSIAVLDIDFFKKINDQYGHLVGDKVLRMIAKEMKAVCRGSDFIARFGGEEFVILLPQTEQTEAVQAMEKVRLHINSRPFHYQSKPVSISVSGGVATKQEGENTDQWIDRADQALYQSKNNGRNLITAA